jgi:phosphoribosylformylglycinamidine synthase subunit PurSL
MWIEVRTTSRDVRKESLQRMLWELGMKAEVVETSDIHSIEGSYSTEEAERIGQAITDKAVQKFSINNQLYSMGSWIILVRYKPQITDPAEQNVLKLISDLGLAANSACSLQKYILKNSNETQIKEICEQLANENTQQYGYGQDSISVSSFIVPSALDYDSSVQSIKLSKANDKELEKISNDNTLSLSLEEMKGVQAYFRKLKRDPNDIELETIAQTWSEHCKHKTFNSEIVFDLFDINGKKTTEIIPNLFKATIVAATDDISKDKNWKEQLVSVFKDNAGIIRLDNDNCIAFKVETHNHPSALDPYGGAGTGIGGVIRDVVGAGLGAKPIFNTDVFCFGSPDYKEELPKTILHPKRLFKGVVNGVRDYGNRMGIPTINGSITFHDQYLAPLVFCGTAGIMPTWAVRKMQKIGDLIVAIGGKTGKDGLHGATFSSTELKEGISTSVVQIGNAIEEKKMLDAILDARDQKLYSAITDCGAGGFSSAVGEIAQEFGADVELSAAQLKQKGMKPWEIWLSESQERMVLTVPEKNLGKLKEICKREETNIAVLGSITKSGKLIVKSYGKIVAKLDMEFLHHGLPKSKRVAVYRAKIQKVPQKNPVKNHNELLKKLLSMPTIASKEWVIRQYDHEVQATSIVKPLTGQENDGPSDASVIRPMFGSKKVVAVSNGINPRYGLISPYWMAAAAIDESLRNIVATGGSISNTAILDNFCWANTSEPERLGTLVMASKACKDIAISYRTPFISGKDSLHNEVIVGQRKIPILDTLLISAISVMDIDNVITMDIKREGSSVYIVGETKDELGGSHYNEARGLGLETGLVPIIEPKKSNLILKAVEESIRKGVVLSCHDLSEGGLAVSISEMCFAGNIGAEIQLENVPFRSSSNVWDDDSALYSESQTRFLLEIKKDMEAEFESILRKHSSSFGMIGKTKGNKLVITGKNGKMVNLGLDELKKSWKSTFNW